MATFYNQATLSYNGNTTTSNMTTGELVEVLSATKQALLPTYSAAGDTVTFTISIVNTGTAPFTGLTITDTLGAYTYGIDTLVPLTHIKDTIQYYTNGVLQPTPTVNDGPPLTITGITVPAGGNATIIYDTVVNQHAPLGTDGEITNEAVISGGGLTNNISVRTDVTAANTANLSISKSMYPTTVSENGQLTYTFIIQNTGNTAATTSDSIIVTDTFEPILNPITVTFNDTAWTSPTNYTYNSTTGEFATLDNQITVPAATYTQNPTTGAWVVTPGVSKLTITGTV